MAGQTELRVLVDKAYLQNLKDRLGTDKNSEIAKAALTLLDWASNEAQCRRAIFSTEQDGSEAHRLVMPALNQIKPKP